jgi:hypothetical protein
MNSKGITSVYTHETIGAVLALRELARRFETKIAGRRTNNGLYLFMAIPGCDLSIAVSTENIACITGTLLEEDIEPIVVAPENMSDEIVSLFAKAK